MSDIFAQTWADLVIELACLKQGARVRRRRAFLFGFSLATLLAGVFCFFSFAEHRARLREAETQMDAIENKILELRTRCDDETNYL